MTPRPGTFELTLPNGEKVRCWQKDAVAIRADILRDANVCLIRDPLTGVYDRVEADVLKAPQFAQHVRRLTVPKA